MHHHDPLSLLITLICMVSYHVTWAWQNMAVYKELWELAVYKAF